MVIKNGDKVTLDYEGKLESGDIFDSSKQGEHSHPLVFVVGSGQVIAGFDKAVKDMKKGEEKEFSIEPKDAYGPYSDELRKEVPISVFPPEKKPEKGMILVMGTPDGRQIPARIHNVNGDSVILDLNHPLARKKLIFKIKILNIEAKAK